MAISVFFILVIFSIPFEMNKHSQEKDLVIHLHDVLEHKINKINLSIVTVVIIFLQNFKLYKLELLKMHANFSSLSLINSLSATILRL
jgi:hypothetical protein